MARFEYKVLDQITESTHPYRGTRNKYPIGNRKQSYKNFTSDYLDGEKVFRIFYGKTYQAVYLPSDEIVAQAIARGEHVCKPDNGSMPFYHEMKPNEVGIVRPDNTFEFTTNSLHQGLCMFINDFIDGWVYRSSRHGGYVYNVSIKNCTEQVFHPMFKGIRFGLGENKDVHESSKYQLTGRSVNRKESKQLMSKYADMFKVSEIMAKTMKPEDFVMTAIEVVNTAYSIDLINAPNSYHHVDEAGRNEILARAEEQVSFAPLDSLILFGTQLDVDGLQFHRLYHQAKNITGNTSTGFYAYYSRLLDPLTAVEAVKRKLSKVLYERNPEVMKVRELEAGKRYPQSDWGFTITVNGKEVEQY
jgi:hypothetical protein